MADFVDETRRPLAPPKADPVVSRRKFGVAYLVLAAIVGAAVGLIVVLSTRNDTTTTRTADFSAWSPTQPDGTARTREIGTKVATGYRLENGHQLVGVLGGPMEFPRVGGPIKVAALLIGAGNAGVTTENVGAAFPNAGIFYQLVGRKPPDGQIEGTPTAVRGALLFREVLELALYTFHYQPQADHIVFFLPPAPGVPQNDPRYQRAIYVPREALRDELSRPLDQTLTPRQTITPEDLTTAEANKVLGILKGRLYHFDYQQLSNSTLILQLTPLEPYG